MCFKESFHRENVFYFVCFIVVTIGIAFRFFNLDALSLWSDELFTVSAALDVGKAVPWYHYTPKVIQELSYHDSFLTWKAADNTPPLFEFLLIIWAKIFGHSDYALRSLPAVLGSLAPLIFILGTRKSLGKTAAIAGGIFLALSPSSIVYSQEVRAYILAEFLATIAVVWLINSLFCRVEKIRASVWYGVLILSFLSYSHYTGLFLSGLLAAIYLLLLSIPRKSYGDILRFLTVPALVLPWIALSYKAFKFSSEGGYAWRDYSYNDIYNFMIPETIKFYFPSFTSMLGLLFFIVFIVLLVVTIKRGVYKNITDRRVLLFLLTGFSIALLFGYSVYNSFTSKMWHPRYFTVSLPLISLLISLMVSLCNKSDFFKKCILFFVIVVMVASLVKYQQIPRAKENYRSAAIFISENIGDGADIMLGWKSNAGLYLHYLNLYIDKDVRFNLIPVSTKEDVMSYCNSLNNRNIGSVTFIFQHSSQPYATFLSECRGLKKESFEFSNNILAEKLVFEGN